MSQRSWALLVSVIVPISWWMLRDNSEAAVRTAHERLAVLISKADGETAAAALLNARALQGMFASDCEVSGDADALVGTYTAESLGSTIFQIRELFDLVELSLQDLSVSLPEENLALASFSVVLSGRAKQEEMAHLIERRSVETRMRRVDGDWLFTAFYLQAPEPAPWTP